MVWLPGKVRASFATEGAVLAKAEDSKAFESPRCDRKLFCMTERSMKKRDGSIPIEK